MANRKTIFITGANRGIGLGLACKFLAQGHAVVAAARNPDGARELWELEHDYKDRFRIVELDVTSDHSIEAAAASMKGQPIDILVNNAGVLPEAGRSFTQLSSDGLLKGFTVNTLGPIRVTQRLLPNLEAAQLGVVATISSKMGSLTDNTSGGSYAYRISKTAVNMFCRSFAADYPGLIAVVLHPGWVQTEMGGETAPTTVDASTSGLVSVIGGLTPKDSGKFLDFRGTELPW